MHLRDECAARMSDYDETSTDTNMQKALSSMVVEQLSSLVTC